MMNPKYYLLAALAALSLGGCSTDDTVTETMPEKGGYKISFTVAEDSETRTTLSETDVMKWVPTDKVGIYTAKSDEQNTNANILTVADVNQSPVEFIGVLDNLVSKGDMFYAYYPYDKAQSTDPKTVKLTIPEAQTQTKAGEYDGQSHPLVALPMAIEWEKDSYAGRINSARFRLLGAIVELQIFSSDETLRKEKIQSVKFVSDTPIAGDFTFDLTGVTVDKEPQITGYKLTEVTTTLAEPAVVPAEDGKALVYLTIAPGKHTGKFVVETDAARYTFNLNEDKATFNRAVIKGLSADLAGAARDASIQFADDKVKGICVNKDNNWDTDKDGELSYEEAAAVTSLGDKFYSKEITSFDELQYFTRLESIEGNAFELCNSLKSIHIPDGVTSIGGNAFRDCSSLTSIQLPDGLTSIEGWAFNGCSGLTSITIPAGVTKIEMYTFQNCKNLTSITIPSGVTTIEGGAFSGCSSLKSINIPKTVTSFGSGVFNKCSSLAEFEGECASSDKRCLILNGTLCAFASAGLTKSEYTIPAGVTAIGKSAFSDCSSLKGITIPEGVTAIGGSAFRGCSGLTSITIPETITTIGFAAFDGCSGLKSITIPDKVTSIGEYAFNGCSSLVSITIPDKVTSIGNYAFARCSSLASVYCKPTTPPTLGNDVFLETSSSLKIYVPEASVDKYQKAEGWKDYTIVAENSQSEPNENDPIQFTDSAVKAICVAKENGWDADGNGELSYKEAAAVSSIGTLFQNTSISSFNELQYFTGLKSIETNAFRNCSSLKSIYIPQAVSSISAQAFAKCSSLSAFYGKYASTDHRCLIQDGTLLAFAEANLNGEYIIPDGVTAIGDYAFYYCGLTRIVLPKGVTSIGNSAFYYCTKLKDVNIPNEVTSIGTFAFYDCAMTSITIPNNVTSIGGDAFLDCNDLISVYCKPTDPPTLGSDAFLYTSSSLKIYVPANSVNAYKEAENWKYRQIVADNN